MSKINEKKYFLIDLDIDSDEGLIIYIYISLYLQSKAIYRIGAEGSGH